MKTIFITKYALSEGILKIDGVQNAEDTDKYSLSGISNDGWYRGDILQINARDHMFCPKDFCYTLEDALKKSELMKQKKITSLKKTLKKLENMKVKIK
jgi:hypothetical protein